MNNRRTRLIALHQIPGMSRSLLKRIGRADSDLLLPYRADAEELVHMLGISPVRAAGIIHHRNDPNIMKKLDKILQHGRVVTWFDRHYPPLLRTIPDPPLILYLQGDASLLHPFRPLSVIGTRKPSKYAYPAMTSVLVPLIEKGFTIISGMAKGIDQYAHQLAVENKGRTIAVLGSGFHHVYPRNNESLYRTLAETQLVISEYPPDQPPKKYHFPERNRIISGLSTATFVVEARLRSGTLITVDQALEQGRDVYALPGPAGSQTSEGCHRMINDGAKLVHTYEDIWEDWE
ncbi:DNA-processing protein DprA [Halobacillus sp. ACCC02827]|uniref:DNA-processing protein DprA n=1 Tax=unclassified Halobacillus TaxID=2636472 RepID=UPI001F2203B1|nr:MULTISPECIES: DNA-processing protein DprA [unclassified Halobacillus]WJE17457.1 DNA-processing protein DprA [Halobacillus sp. ACCC02827]